MINHPNDPVRSLCVVSCTNVVKVPVGVPPFDPGKKGIRVGITVGMLYQIVIDYAVGFLLLYF